MVALTIRPNRYFSLTEREIRRFVSSQDMVDKMLKWKGEAGDETGRRGTGKGAVERPKFKRWNSAAVWIQSGRFPIDDDTDMGGAV